MQQILKRLEPIKTSIVLEDQEIIELQISKLSTMSKEQDIRMLLATNGFQDTKIIKSNSTYQ